MNKSFFIKSLHKSNEAIIQNYAEAKLSNSVQPFGLNTNPGTCATILCNRAAVLVLNLPSETFCTCKQSETTRDLFIQWCNSPFSVTC